MGARLPRSIPEIVDTGRGWLGGLRLKAVTWAVGIALATLALIMLTPIGWVPAVGIAVAATVVAVTQLADRLDKPTCYGCGTDLSAQPDGAHGIRCHACGSLHQGRRRLHNQQIDPRAIVQTPDEDESKTA